MPVAWPSGLRRWFKAPVSSEAWVRIPPLPNVFPVKYQLLFVGTFVFFIVVSKNVCGDAGDRTRGLSHAKRTLYR